MKRLRAVLMAALTLGLVAVALPASAAGPQTGAYVAISPTRLVDTRTGNGAAKAPIGPKGTISVQVAGRGNVPATGVSAVVANVTVVSPTSAMFLAVYPAGQTRPVGSSINVAAGKTRANQTTVVLGTGGKLKLYNSAGSSNVVLDVVGYYLAGESAPEGVIGSGFQDLAPERVFDTRTTDAPALEPGEAAAVAISFKNAPQNARVTALAVNLTVTSPTTAGFLNAWDGRGNPPSSSAINFAAGQTVANTAIVSTSPCEDCTGDDANAPTFVVLNRAAGSTNVVVDVVGYYGIDVADNLYRFVPLATPRRIVDTRSGLNGSTFASGQTRSLHATSVLSSLTGAVVTNVTGISGNKPTFISVWPSGPRPAPSNLNLNARETAANGATLGLDFDGSIKAFTKNGPTNLIVDVTGRFDYLGDGIDPPARSRASSAPASPSVSTVTVRRFSTGR